jgi:hypothetical protein
VVSTPRHACRPQPNGYSAVLGGTRRCAAARLSAGPRHERHRGARRRCAACGSCRVGLPSRSCAGEGAVCVDDRAARMGVRRGEERSRSSVELVFTCARGHVCPGGRGRGFPLKWAIA